MLLGGVYTASAQYYTWGADAPYMKWHKVKGKQDKIDVIFPDTAASLGYRMMHYAQQTQGSIEFGFRHGPMKILLSSTPRISALTDWLCGCQSVSRYSRRRP